MSDEIVTERAQEQAKFLQQWLQHAPGPPERGANTYDVFISYRSSDRAWGMSLYDALKQTGWEPFLDQYDLVPGTNLETSLSESLEASSSGVILWSSRTKVSDWCKKERQAMTTLKNDRGKGPHPFNYIFAKLDAEPLPVFARSDLYSDFEDSPEGPRGVNLLKLMCGMRGVALDPKAVIMAQQVDQDAQQTMIVIRGAIESGNATRLREVGTSAEPGVLASPGPVIQAAQGLISLGKNEDALVVLKHAYAHFPKSISVKRLEGLALRRLKRYQEAIEVLSQLKAAGHQDPETMGMLGAAWDGRYQESGKTLHLRTSREMYRTAFQGDSKDYYTGINAAAKSLFLGESQEAERLAANVLPLVQAASDGNDFWAGCTLGEVYLLQRDLNSAATQYQKVIDKHPVKTGDLAGTRRQATRICSALKLSEEETKKVLSPFELLD